MKLSHLFFLLIGLLFFLDSYAPPSSGKNAESTKYEMAAPYRFIILKYNQIGNEKTDPKNSISLEQFLSHIEEFKKNKYHVAYFGHYAFEMKQTNAHKKGMNPERKYVHLTFDGVHQSFYKEAFPVLKRLRWPFILFLESSKIGKDPNYLNWDQLKEIISYPKVKIGCKTHTGKSLLNLSREESFREVFQCISTLKQKLKIQAKIFAYPKGEFDRISHSFIASLNRVSIEQSLSHFFSVRKVFLDLKISLDDYYFFPSKGIFQNAFTEVPNVFNNDKYLGSSDFLLPRIPLNFHNASKENLLKMINYAHIPSVLFGSNNVFADTSEFPESEEYRKKFFRLWVASLFEEKIECYIGEELLEKIPFPQWVPDNKAFTSNFNNVIAINVKDQESNKLREDFFFLEFKIPKHLHSAKSYLIDCRHPAFTKGQQVYPRRYSDRIDIQSLPKKEYFIFQSTDPYRNYYYLINP